MASQSATGKGKGKAGKGKNPAIGKGKGKPGKSGKGEPQQEDTQVVYTPKETAIWNLIRSLSHSYKGRCGGAWAPGTLTADEMVKWTNQWWLGRDEATKDWNHFTEALD